MSTDPELYSDIPDIGDAADPGEPAVGAPHVRAPTGDPKRHLAWAGPTRADVTKRRWIAAIASLAWIAVQLVTLHVRTDVPRVSIGYLAVIVVLPAVLAAGTFFTAVWPGRSGLGLPVGWPLGFAIASVLTYAFVVLAVPEPYGFVDPFNLTFWQWTTDCFDVVVAMGAGPLVFAALAWRHAFAAGALPRSAAVGVACGLMGAAAMGLHCENVTQLHVVVAHGLPSVLLGVIGAWVIRRVTRP